MTALNVFPMSGRSQHHDGKQGQIGSPLDFLDQRKTIHLRHVHVGEQQMVGLARIAGADQLGQSLLSGVHALGAHLPGVQHRFHDALIGAVIVDDQHFLAAEAFGRDWNRRLAVQLHDLHRDGEMKLTAVPKIAVQPDLPAQHGYETSRNSQA